MNLQQLRYVVTLADCLSFGEAAERCAVTQPTLSNAVAQLEAELGRALFARTTRQVSLTDFGRGVLPSIADVLQSQAALLARARKLADPDRQVIRLGVSPLMGLGRIGTILDPFRRTHPKAELVYREMNLESMRRLAEAGQLEFVFGPVDPGGAAPAGWTAIPLQEEPLVYVARDQTANSPTEVRLVDIAEETFVMVPDDCGLARATRALFRDAKLALRTYPGEAMSYRALQDWARIGIGAAILPLSKCGGGPAARILTGASGDSHAMIAFQVLARPEADLDPVARDLTRYLAEVAPQILRGLA